MSPLQPLRRLDGAIHASIEVEDLWALLAQIEPRALYAMHELAREYTTLARAAGREPATVNALGRALTAFGGHRKKTAGGVRAWYWPERPTWTPIPAAAAWPPLPPDATPTPTPEPAGGQPVPVETYLATRGLPAPTERELADARRELFESPGPVPDDDDPDNDPTPDGSGAIGRYDDDDPFGLASADIDPDDPLKNFPWPKDGTNS